MSNTDQDTDTSILSQYGQVSSTVCPLMSTLCTPKTVFVGKSRVDAAARLHLETLHLVCIGLTSVDIQWYEVVALKPYPEQAWSSRTGQGWVTN